MIALPAEPATVLRDVIVPALALLPDKLRSPRAQVMLLTIAQQESDLAARRQANNGPARGLWQFERGGVNGVMGHPASEPLLVRACAGLGVPFQLAAIHAALETSDTLACIVARLLLYTLPQPLPPIGYTDGAWRQYIEAWRPGKPRPLTWSRNYQTAIGALP